MVAVVAPVLHRKDIPPDAVIVLEPPGQIAWLTQTIVQIGGVFTVTVLEHEDVHPLEAFVTVTV